MPHDPARREDGRGRDVRTGGHARALSHATRQRRNLRRYRAVECGNNEGRSPRQDLPLHGLQEGLASVSREETAPTPRTFGAAANGSRGARPVPPKLMCSRLRASRARSRPRIARIAPAMGRGVTSSWFLPLRRRRDELPGSCPSPPSAHGRNCLFEVRTECCHSIWLGLNGRSLRTRAQHLDPEATFHVCNTPPAS